MNTNPKFIYAQEGDAVYSSSHARVGHILKVGDESIKVKIDFQPRPFEINKKNLRYDGHALLMPDSLRDILRSSVLILGVKYD